MSSTSTAFSIGKLLKAGIDSVFKINEKQKEVNRKIYSEWIKVSFKDIFISEDQLRWISSKGYNLEKLVMLILSMDEMKKHDIRFKENLIDKMANQQFERCYDIRLNKFNYKTVSTWFGWNIIDDSHLLKFYSENENAIENFKVHFKELYEILFDSI